MRRLVEHLTGRLAKARWTADLLEWDNRTYGTPAQGQITLNCRPCSDGLTVAFKCGQALRLGCLLFVNTLCNLLAYSRC